MGRKDRGQNILSTYFSTNVKHRVSITKDLARKIRELQDQSTNTPNLTTELAKDLQSEVSNRIRTKSLLDFTGVVKGSTSAAIYQKRSGGVGEIPDEMYEVLRERLDVTAGSWELKHDKDSQVYMSSEEGQLCILETALANVPLSKAIDILIYSPSSRFYKTQESLEEIGPSSRITYLAHKKTSFGKILPAKLDMVVFQSSKRMDDGSLMVLTTSVEHPKAPSESSKKERVQLIYGGVILTSAGPTQTRVSILSAINGTKPNKSFMAIVSIGKQALRFKKLMENPNDPERRSSGSQ
eukprot:TRINITY_DN21552_c0_g1_i1.p1 TRINITY_DN21552_c0_g1~~TRINITY_DN21552_c0_g1_i1.p1  ORF type:complete len:326 (-),score=70.59 TRINITY_DN21552_c0_g1_i1:115-1002(-)